MTAFYRRSVNNLEMRHAIKDSVQRLQLWNAEPNKMLPLQQDVLGNYLREDTTLDLTLPPLSAEIILKPLLQATINVFKRQFKPFLDGDLADPTDEDIAKAVHASSHNMDAEHILGLTDNMCRKAPNTTSAFLSGKLRYRLNGTREWLEQHEQQDLLIDFVVKEGYKAEAHSRCTSKGLSKELQERRQAVAQGREDAMRKGVGATIERLIAQPPTDAAGIDLFDNLASVVTEKVLNLLQNNNFMQGHLIRHNWFEDNTVKSYYGRIMEAKTKTIRKMQKVVLPITRWTKRLRQMVVRSQMISHWLIFSQTFSPVTSRLLTKKHDRDRQMSDLFLAWRPSSRL